VRGWNRGKRSTRGRLQEEMRGKLESREKQIIPSGLLKVLFLPYSLPDPFSTPFYLSPASP